MSFVQKILNDSNRHKFAMTQNARKPISLLYYNGIPQLMRKSSMLTLKYPKQCKIVEIFLMESQSYWKNGKLRRSSGRFLFSYLERGKYDPKSGDPRIIGRVDSTSQGWLLIIIALRVGGGADSQSRWNWEAHTYVHTFPQFPRKPYLIPDQNGQSLYLFSDQNGAQNTPFGAALASHADVLRGLSHIPTPLTSADSSGKKRRPITAHFKIWEVYFGPWEISCLDTQLQKRSKRSWKGEDLILLEQTIS